MRQAQITLCRHLIERGRHSERVAANLVNGKLDPRSPQYRVLVELCRREVALALGNIMLEMGPELLDAVERTAPPAQPPVAQSRRLGPGATSRPT